ncbi:MAG: phosphoribosyltransferase family protein [Flavobacteriales bacterium]
MTTEDKVLVLNEKQIKQKIQRIAHEIYENHYKEKEIVIVGIKDSGLILANRLKKLIEKISDISVTLYSLELHKDKPTSNPIIFSGETEDLKNKAVLVIDDVLNSGRTLIHVVKYLLDYPVKTMKTVVLVDRFHRKFPIKADIVGMTLSTNMKEHVSVDFTKPEAVYLA